MSDAATGSDHSGLATQTLRGGRHAWSDLEDGCAADAGRVAPSPAMSEVSNLYELSEDDDEDDERKVARLEDVPVTPGLRTGAATTAAEAGKSRWGQHPRDFDDDDAAATAATAAATFLPSASFSAAALTTPEHEAVTASPSPSPLPTAYEKAGILGGSPMAHYGDMPRVLGYHQSGDGEANEGDGCGGDVGGGGGHRRFRSTYMKPSPSSASSSDGGQTLSTNKSALVKDIRHSLDAFDRIASRRMSKQSEEAERRHSSMVRAAADDDEAEAEAEAEAALDVAGFRGQQPSPRIIDHLAPEQSQSQSGRSFGSHAAERREAKGTGTGTNAEPEPPPVHERHAAQGAQRRQPHRQPHDSTHGQDTAEASSRLTRMMFPRKPSLFESVAVVAGKGGDSSASAEAAEEAEEEDRYGMSKQASGEASTPPPEPTRISSWRGAGGEGSFTECTNVPGVTRAEEDGYTMSKQSEEAERRREEETAFSQALAAKAQSSTAGAGPGPPVLRPAPVDAEDNLLSAVVSEAFGWSTYDDNGGYTNGNENKNENEIDGLGGGGEDGYDVCLLYTSPSPRDATLSRMPSSA